MTLLAPASSQARAFELINRHPQLQMAGPGRQGDLRRLVDCQGSSLIGYGLLRVQVLAVALRECLRRLAGDEVRAQALVAITQRPADDLLDLSLVQIDARPEAGHGRCSEGGLWCLGSSGSL